MKHYPDVASALIDGTRLARGMTYKWAASGIDGGGGKAVIAVPSDMDSRSRKDLLRRYVIEEKGELCGWGSMRRGCLTTMDIEWT